MRAFCVSGVEKINNKGLDTLLLELELADMNHEEQTLIFDYSIAYTSPTEDESIRAREVRRRYAELEQIEFIESNS